MMRLIPLFLLVGIASGELINASSMCDMLLNLTGPHVGREVGNETLSHINYLIENANLTPLLLELKELKVSSEFRYGEKTCAQFSIELSEGRVQRVFFGIDVRAGSSDFPWISIDLKFVEEISAELAKAAERRDAWAYFGLLFKIIGGMWRGEIVIKPWWTTFRLLPLLPTAYRIAQPLLAQLQAYHL